MIRLFLDVVYVSCKLGANEFPFSTMWLWCSWSASVYYISAVHTLCHAVSIFVGQLPNNCIHTTKWITTHFLGFSSFRPTVPIKMYSKFYFFHYLRQHGSEATPTRSFEVQTDPVKLPDVPVKIRKGSRILYPSQRSLGDFMPPLPSIVGQKVWLNLTFY